MRRVFHLAFTGLLTFGSMATARPQADASDDTNAIVDPGLFAHLRYRCVGPTRGGRATTVTGVRQEPGTFYMGATGGGIWKTTDYGERWRNVSDGFLETPSIGAIRVAPSDPEIVYAGTGSDGLRSNVITGRGVYKSQDAGETWDFVGLRDAGQIGALEIHPDDPDIVYVAAIGMAFGPSGERGVYRTRDGGQTWQQVLHVSRTCGAVDLELNPENPEEIYASMWHVQRKPWTIISGATEGGIYKSTDAGESWKKLAGGLPTGLFGKSDLAVSPADADLIYVLIEANPGGGLYRSEDRGETWELASTRRGLLDRPFYYCNVDVDPNDPAVLYVNATSLHKSTNAGESWTRMRTPHGDNHDIWIHPDDSELLIQANDGGVNVSQDGGRTWSTQRNQPTAELYQVAVDDRHPYWLYAGQQDNSTIRVPSASVPGYRGGPDGQWQAVGGCETGPAVPKPGDPDIVYAACKGRFGVYNARTGQERQYYVGMANMYGHNPRDLKYRFQRVSPIHVSPHDPNVVYHASQYVHRTLDEGRTWETISPDLTAFEPDKQVFSGEPITKDITGEECYSALYALRESPLERGLIWVGSNDGPIHVTRDGGQTWQNVTPADLPPGGRVQTVEPSPHDPRKAYVAVYRFLLGDWQPYIYRTDDYGASWTRLTTGTNGIPLDSPTRVVREDPDREGLLYAGTEFGVFVSFDDGHHWQSLQLNLPRTPVTDIVVHRRDVVLSTMGRSFWILDDVTPLHQISSRTSTARAQLYRTRLAYRQRGASRRRRGGTRIGVPTYAPVGVHIDYYLPAAIDEVTLEIVDESQEIVARFTGRESSGEDERSGPDRQASPAELGGMFGGGSGAGFEQSSRRRSPASSRRLDTSAGAHRFVWDLRRSGRSGMVAPGPYRARLLLGGETQAIDFHVALDPRLVGEGVSAADIRAQLAFLDRVSEVQARANDLVDELARLRTFLAGVMATESFGARLARRADARFADLQARLTTRPGGRYEQPMLTSQLSYLASNSARADQAPGNHAHQRLSDLEAELRSCVEELARIEGRVPDPTRLTLDRIFDSIELLSASPAGLEWSADGSAYSMREHTSRGPGVVSYDVESGRRKRGGAVEGRGSVENAKVEETSLTAPEGPGVHAYDVAPGGQWAFHTYSTFDTPPVTRLISLPDREEVRVLQDHARLKARLAALRRRAPEFFQVEIRDGVELDGWCMKPPDFDFNKRYPVLFCLGGGPDAELLADRWGGARYLWHLLLTQEGYLVMSVGKHDTPTADQAAAARAIFDRWSYVDPARVGVYGSHAGCSSLQLMLEHPDLYSVAMLAVGIEDEWSSPSRGEVVPTAALAAGLKGQLLIIQGEGASQPAIDALAEAGSRFSRMTLAGDEGESGPGTPQRLCELYTWFLRQHLPVTSPGSGR